MKKLLIAFTFARLFLPLNLYADSNSWSCEATTLADQKVHLNFLMESPTLISDVRMFDEEGITWMGLEGDTLAFDTNYKPRNVRYKKFNRFARSAYGEVVYILLPKKISQTRALHGYLMLSNYHADSATEVVRLVCSLK